MPDVHIGPAAPPINYQALLDLIKSGDPRGLQAAQHLTADEQQQFFDFQQAQPKTAEQRWGDVGNTEGLLTGAAIGPAGRAIASGVSGGGGGLAAKTLSGIKATITQAAPAVKYELTKSTLEHLGVPTPIASAAGMMVSGMRRGRAAAESTAAEATSPAEMSAAPPAPAASSASAPSAGAPPPATPVPEPALKILGALKQAGYSDAERTQAVQWLQRGVSAEDVVARLHATRALQGQGPFANLPTDLDMAKAQEVWLRTNRRPPAGGPK